MTQRPNVNAVASQLVSIADELKDLERFINNVEIRKAQDRTLKRSAWAQLVILDETMSKIDFVRMDDATIRKYVDVRNEFTELGRRLELWPGIIPNPVPRPNAA